MEEQAAPPAAATATAGVTATIDLSAAAADLGGVHLLPCGIMHNGGAPVSDYFKPRSTGAEVDGVRVEEAFFRGRKLLGATLPLPEGYQGYVLEKKSGGKHARNSDNDFTSFVSRAKFQNITYWNHDSTPSAEDPLPRCFHWLTVANAMHKPVTAEELANMSAMKNGTADQDTSPDDSVFLPDMTAASGVHQDAKKEKEFCYLISEAPAENESSKTNKPCTTSIAHPVHISENRLNSL